VHAEDIEKKVDDLLEDYLVGADIKEAIAAIKELEDPNYHAEIVNKSISLGLEKKESDRESISKLFAVLYEENVFTQAQFAKG
jgi:hypothetical protein